MHIITSDNIGSTACQAVPARTAASAKAQPPPPRHLRPPRRTNSSAFAAVLSVIFFLFLKIFLFLIVFKFYFYYVLNLVGVLIAYVRGAMYFLQRHLTLQPLVVFFFIVLRRSAPGPEAASAPIITQYPVLPVMTSKRCTTFSPSCDTWVGHPHSMPLC